MMNLMEEGQEKTEEKKSGGYGKRPLWQWIAIYAVVGIIIYGAAYYFLFSKKGGYNAQTTQYPSPTHSASSGQASPSVSQATTSAMTVLLATENKSGESGTAILKEVAGKTVVTLSLIGYPANAQPAHIHIGACPGVGAVKYPLTNVVNGQSVTTLHVTIAELEQELPLAINVNASAKDINNYTACGPLK